MAVSGDGGRGSWAARERERGAKRAGGAVVGRGKGEKKSGPVAEKKREMGRTGLTTREGERKIFHFLKAPNTFN